MDTFYDDLARFYHLVYEDWNASIARQGVQLSSLIESEWPGSETVLDLSCGIGTQSIALARQGYSVMASDISPNCVLRARQESKTRQLSINFSVADLRNAAQHHGNGFDVVISADNSLPHLLTDDDLLRAFKEMLGCLLGGGGCIVSIRDYEREQRGKNILKPYGVRVEDGKRFLIFQVWDFEGDYYDLSFFIVEENQETAHVTTHVMRSRYYAVSLDKLQELMRLAGFSSVRRIDDAFFQPIVVGTKAR
jgi:SAM-dependent methyltransferase